MPADMAINIFTYDPGATLPFVESHVMEHGMMFLEGGGVYRLDADWHPVTAGDAIWLAAYLPAVVHRRRPRTGALHLLQGRQPAARMISPDAGTSMDR